MSFFFRLRRSWSRRQTGVIALADRNGGHGYFRLPGCAASGVANTCAVLTRSAVSVLYDFKSNWAFRRVAVALDWLMLLRYV